jgi:DNA-binding transcriptional ArsR family regulator
VQIGITHVVVENEQDVRFVSHGFAAFAIGLAQVLNSPSGKFILTFKQMLKYYVSVNNTPIETGVFQAIADPTRRQILAQLRGSDEQTPTQIAAPLTMTLSAVSQHLKILREAGLVSVRRAGRERWYRLEAHPLREVSEWASTYERFWTEKIDALSEYLDEQVKGEGEKEK